MQMMDKLVIICNGDVNKAFDRTYGKIYDFLGKEDVEITWSYITQDDIGLSTVTLYGFEPVEGVIKRLIDNRKKNSLTKQLNGIGVNVVNITHSVVDSNEYELIKNKIEPDEEQFSF